MGGTTTKAAVVIEHQPILVTEYEVGAYGSGSARAERGRGYPVNTTVIDVVEVGTGGGSIAWIDSGISGFRVGPRSAGAAPGPACYALGGDRPTGNRREPRARADPPSRSPSAARSGSTPSARARVSPI